MKRILISILALGLACGLASAQQAGHNDVEVDASFGLQALFGRSERLLVGNESIGREIGFGATLSAMKYFSLVKGEKPVFGAGLAVSVPAKVRGTLDGAYAVQARLAWRTVQTYSSSEGKLDFNPFLHAGYVFSGKGGAFGFGAGLKFLYDISEDMYLCASTSMSIFGAKAVYGNMQAYPKATVYGLDAVIGLGYRF